MTKTTIAKPLSDQEVQEKLAQFPYSIKEATMKDGFINYTYVEIIDDRPGDTHVVKGTGLYKPDMSAAFSGFNVHLAAIDDIFKHAEVEIKAINKMGGHELATLYTVSSFKIKGGEDDEAIVLIGDKYVTVGGRMDLESRKVPLDNASSYKWFKDLKKIADRVRLEVALYKEGKWDAVEEDEPEEKTPKAPKLKFGDGNTGTDEDFEKAKVQ